MGRLHAAPATKATSMLQSSTSTGTASKSFSAVNLTIEMTEP